MFWKNPRQRSDIINVVDLRKKMNRLLLLQYVYGHKDLAWGNSKKQFQRGKKKAKYLN